MKTDEGSKPWIVEERQLVFMAKEKEKQVSGPADEKQDNVPNENQEQQIAKLRALLSSENM